MVPRIKVISKALLIYSFVGFVALMVSSRSSLAQRYPVPSAVTLSAHSLESVPDLSAHRFEAGTLMSNMRLGCVTAAKCTAPQMAIGSGAAFNLNQHFALDSTLLTTVGNDATQTPSSAGDGGKATEFLAGGRAEVRTRRFGFFGVDRPGLVHWSSALAGENLTLNNMGTFDVSYQHTSRTYFANEFGGGAEYSPNARVHVRLEMDDVMVHENTAMRYNVAGIILPVCQGSCTKWTNNLQTTASVYLSAGRAMAWSSGRYGDFSNRPFLDRTNIGLLSASLLAQAADAITTQRFLHHGIVEGNPLAAPFVKYGWSGQIGLALLTNFAEIGGMRAFHSMHRYRMERMIPLSIASASATMAYRNQQLSDRPAK